MPKVYSSCIVFLERSLSIYDFLLAFCQRPLEVALFLPYVERNTSREKIKTRPEENRDIYRGYSEYLYLNYDFLVTVRLF